MVRNPVDEFFQQYDYLAEDISIARYELFNTHLRSWFSLLEDEPIARIVVASLEERVDFDSWYGRQNLGGGLEGSGELDWPRSLDESLGLRIALLRSFSDKRLDATDFAQNFLYSGSGYDEDISAVAQQIVRPTVRDLRRKIQRAFVSPTEASAIPASDRTVTLKHNSPEYREAVSALERVEQALRETNDYLDVEDREQRIAEISAGRRLLDAPRVWLGAIRATSARALKYLSEKAVGETVAFAVTTALAALGKLFGIL